MSSICKGRYTYDVQENFVIFKTPPSPPPHPQTTSDFSTPLTLNIQSLILTHPLTHPRTLSNKLQNNYGTVRVHEQNQNKNKRKPSRVTFKLTTCSSVQLNPRTMK